MCGRYTQSRDSVYLQDRFKFVPSEIELQPRYNIGPGQTAPVVVGADPRELKLMRWGLIPHWAKEEKIGYRMINARADTLNSKPSFKGLLRKRRCLVLADGFYEWAKSKDMKVKTPFRYILKGGDPFAMAGLWTSWKAPDGSWLESYTIITTDSNELVSAVHDRMPVILPEEKEGTWLDPGMTDPYVLAELLNPYPAGLMEGYEVSRRVNPPANEGEELVRPVER